MKPILYFVFLFFAFLVKAQPPAKFYTKIGSNGYEYAYDVKQTLDGGYIICGSTSSFGQGNTDSYLFKLDSMGQIKFEKTFGGPQNDCAKSVIQLLDSSYVITGYSNSFGVGGYNIYLAQIDKNGGLIWQKNLGGDDWDFAYSMNQTNDGGLIICGTTYSYGRGKADGYVLKTDLNGNIIWQKTYGGKHDDEFKSVIQTQDGNYALTGYTKSYNDTVNGDAWIFKLDANGDSIWCKSYGGTGEDYALQIIQHPSSEFYLAGSTSSIGLGLMDAYAFKTDNIGNLIWQQVDGISGQNECFNSVTISGTNSSISCYSETETFPGYGIHIKIFELGASSFYHNGTEYGGTKADEIFKIITTKDKGYAGVGYTENYGAELSDAFFLKLDSNLVGSISIVSVKENNLNSYSLSIYPNPANAHLNVFINQRSKLDVSKLNLVDMSGREIPIKYEVVNPEFNQVTINTIDLPNGVYFLKFENIIKRISVIH